MTDQYAIAGLDHVQLAMPAGAEDAAESFYCGVLGFTREPKPLNLAARGGCWFRRGAVSVHLGVEAEFRPAKKAHPAFVVSGFDALVASLAAQQIAFRPDDELPGVTRGYVEDPFGNRIELIAQEERT
jgi:catechol 2,3-dioxygenase-like lactoylglutathione lyase family enzyme